MSETFPDDVMKAAMRVWADIVSGTRDAKQDIARAIADERERAAKVAYDGLRDGLDTPEAIAAAIRGTNA